jgi:uncharacterized membrane protein YhaH (DUF805 family)
MSDRLQDAASGRAAPKGGFGAWIGGRARRREYWLWAVPWFIAVMVAASVAPGSEVILGPVLLCVWIRRLHDLGRTGWIAPLINIAIGIIGWIEIGVMSPGGGGGAVQGLASMAVLIVLGALPGQHATNAYGPPPGPHRDVAETFS